MARHAYLIKNPANKTIRTIFSSWKKARMYVKEFDFTVKHERRQHDDDGHFITETWVKPEVADEEHPDFDKRLEIVKRRMY